jgi:hypothetical protein
MATNPPTEVADRIAAALNALIAAAERRKQLTEAAGSSNPLR